MWAKIWGCNYTGWRSGARVYYTCKLTNPVTGVTYSSFSGNFNGGTYAPPSRYFLTSNMYLCSEASAYSADGGDSDKKCA